MAASKRRLTNQAFSFSLKQCRSSSRFGLAEFWGMLPALKLVLLNLRDAGWFKALDEFRAHRRFRRAISACGPIDPILRLIGRSRLEATPSRASHRASDFVPRPRGRLSAAWSLKAARLYRQAIAKIAASFRRGRNRVGALVVRLAHDVKIASGAAEALRDRLCHVGLLPCR